MIRFFIYFCFAFLFGSCVENSARRPVLVKSNTFLKSSAHKNKQLLEKQELTIDSIIQKDSLHNYISTAHGFKFYYLNENIKTKYTPKFGDKVDYFYEISDIFGKKIYQKKNKLQSYYVDKQEVFKGLQIAIKLLKENEIAVFLFPSELGFGQIGNKQNIKANEPIRVEIQIVKITPSEENIKTE